MSTPKTITRVGEDRRNLEEQAIAIEEAQSRPQRPPPTTPAKPAVPPRHSIPLVASFIVKAERMQADYPELARRPFLEKSNTLLGLAQYVYQQPGKIRVPNERVSEILVLDSEIKNALEALWISFRRMVLTRDKFSEPAVMPELERRRAELLKNPEAADIVLSTAEEVKKIRTEFRERRNAIEASWYQNHGADFFRLHLQMLGSVLDALESLIQSYHDRDQDEARHWGFDSDELPPDLTTLALLNLHVRLHSALVSATRNNDSFVAWLSGHEVGLGTVCISFDAAILALLGVEELPIPRTEEERKAEIAAASAELEAAQAQLKRLTA